MPPLYPLKFEPIFKSALWGGRHLATYWPQAPADGPLAEAWVLSDQGDNVSRVTNGPFLGTTLRDLMRDRRQELLGPTADRHDQFPLLLKFIDARDHLSVQVHPDDDLARKLAGQPRGKTEAWVVLHAEPGARIFAGLRSGLSRKEFADSLANGTAEQVLHSFTPQPGDCVFLPAGTVHALGAGLLIFEVQQSSDITYRLCDWGRVDPRTGQPRELHIEAALACTDFAAGPRGPTWPTLDHSGPIQRERLVRCDYFTLYRYHGERSFIHDGSGAGSVLVCLEGHITIRGGEHNEPLCPGDVLLIPAVVGPVECVASGPYVMLECVPSQ